jgi:lactate dehydrogenase-like 2-hydroxyacid dehydrogenase
LSCLHLLLEKNPCLALTQSYVPNVKVISVNGVGYDGVDVAAVTEAGIFLANAPVLRDACADMAMLLMLAVMRQAPVGQAVAAGSQPNGWDWDAMRRIIGEDPGGKTLGLIGFGRIGQTFAAKAQAAFKMNIVYYDPVKSPPNRTTGGTDAGGEASTPYFELDPPPQWVTLDELLATSDVVSMHASLSASTRRLMSAPQFAKMKTGSYFVNMARGGLVDEEALADALLSGHLAGAGIGETRNHRASTHCLNSNCDFFGC